MIPKEIAIKLVEYYLENQICPICGCKGQSNTGHVDISTCDNCGFSWVA